MAFHDVLFPIDISYGSSGGPGYMTNIIVTDSGAEERISRWDQARRQYNVAYGVKSMEVLAALRDFYIARRGPAAAFRFKDFLDCTTSATGVDPSLGGPAITALDQQFGTGDGETTQYQLFKRYTDPAISIVTGTSPGIYFRNRNITKLDPNNTILVAVDEQVITNWSINVNSGLLTFSNPVPSEGQNLTWGGFFHVPVRFGKSVDAVFEMSVDNFGSGTALEIPLVEVIEDNESQDEFFYGGSKLQTISTSMTLSILDGRVQEFDPQTGGLAVNLPSPLLLPGGGPYFYLINKSTVFEIVIQNFQGLVLATLGTQEVLIAVLSKDTAITGTWYLL